MMDGLMSCILLTSLKVSELLLLVLIVLSVLLQGGGHAHMSQDGVVEVERGEEFQPTHFKLYKVVNVKHYTYIYV